LLAERLITVKEFRARQKAGSFSLDRAFDSLQKGAGER